MRQVAYEKIEISNFCHFVEVDPMIGKNWDTPRPTLQIERGALFALFWL
jgi:hypothetical protein